MWKAGGVERAMRKARDIAHGSSHISPAPFVRRPSKTGVPGPVHVRLAADAQALDQPLVPLLVLALQIVQE
jgi:hypothetical protein